LDELDIGQRFCCQLYGLVESILSSIADVDQLDDLGLELGCMINLSDTVESVKWKLSSQKFCPISNIHFTINGKEIPNAAALRDHLDMNTRFMCAWHSPIV